MINTNSINIDVNSEEKAVALQIQAEVERGIGYLNQKQAEPAILAFKLAFEKARENSSIKDIITHNLLTAYRMRIAEILKQPDVTPVNRYLPEIDRLNLTGEFAQNPDFRGRFADTFRNLGMDFYEARQHEAALFYIRKAISFQPCPSYYVDLTNALAFLKKTAQLRDYTTAYKPSELGRHIFIACSPKSGSTFLKNVLAGVTGFKDLFSVYAALQNEHELDLPQFIKFGKQNTVTQQHSRASEANIQMMQAFAIKPVILVRNIYDSVISLLDFYTKGFTFSTFFDKEEFLKFDEEKKIDLLIEYAIPWYFQFVASWQRAERENRLEIMWLTYEQMIADKTKTVQNIFDFYGIHASEEIIRQKIFEIESDGEKNRFNKGIAGRGKAQLTVAQKEKIRHLATFFPTADFSVISL